MAAQNKIGSKNYAGPLHGGEGKENLKENSTYEYMGVHKAGPNPKLSVEAGFTSDHDGAEEKGGINAALGTEGYGGAQRVAFKPEDKGDVTPGK